MNEPNDLLCAQNQPKTGHSERHPVSDSPLRGDLQEEFVRQVRDRANGRWTVDPARPSRRMRKRSTRRPAQN